VSSTAFSWEFLSSSAAQFCQEPKGLEVEKIQAALGVPRGCTLIYDDT
jgi:hypothetical protein